VIKIALPKYGHEKKQYETVGERLKREAMAHDLSACTNAADNTQKAVYDFRLISDISLQNKRYYKRLVG